MTNALVCTQCAVDRLKRKHGAQVESIEAFQRNGRNYWIVKIKE